MRAHVARHERADALERGGRDAAPVAQPVDELAVVDDEATESGLRDTGVPAVLSDLAKQ